MSELYEEVELTQQQTARIDQVTLNTVNYLISLMNRPLTEEETNTLWDASVWCEIADFASDVLLRHNMHAHFPTRIWDNNGDRVVLIENYYGKGE